MNASAPASVLIFGSINVDMVAEVERIPHAGETVLAARGVHTFGGKGGNQAVAAARARRSRATRVLMAGAVGDDALGQDSLTNLEANGVETGLIRRTAQPTGFAFITVDGKGENAITVISGANLDVASAQVSDTDLAGCSMVAMQLEIPIDEAIALAERAREAGARSLVNLAPIPASASKDALTALLAAIDFAVFNEYELALIMERLGLASGSAHGDRAADLARAFDLVVVVTLGADGALLADAQGTVSTLPTVPVEVVDTTGAGDTFTGVLAATLAEGASPLVAAQRANKAAALACQALGAQSAMPSAEQIDR